tara:strand:+ start:772 stop:1017 length:246 start_codon:yes stop_codon:yes gene_type:complete
MGIFNKILGSILKSRTNTVAKMLGNDPELQRLAKDLNKATDKLEKQIEKTRKSGTQSRMGTDGAFSDLQKKYNKKYGKKYF